MVKSIAEICEDDSNKAVVEDSDGYIFYQLVFMLAYGVVCLLCSYMLGSEWKKAQKVTINNNRYVWACGCLVAATVQNAAGRGLWWAELTTSLPTATKLCFA